MASFLAGRLVDVVYPHRHFVDASISIGDRLFGVDPFFDRLSHFVIYHEDYNILVLLSRPTNSEHFRVVFISEQLDLACDITAKEIESKAEVLDLRIQRFVGHRLQQSGKLSTKKLQEIGFGSADFSTPPGYILYKHFDSEEQTVGLGNLVSKNIAHYYVMHRFGGISIVDLGPVLESVKRLCSR